MRKLQSTAVFLSFLGLAAITLPARAEEAKIIVEADGSKHWDNTYGNGYAAARILDRVADIKREDFEKTRRGLQLEIEAMLSASREEQARYRAMLAKERAEYDGLQKEHRRLENEVMENFRSRLDRAEHILFQLKVSDTVQVKKSFGKLGGTRGKIVKIESGEATVALQCGLSKIIPTRQLINLRALPLSNDERELVNQYQDAKSEAWDYHQRRLEAATPK
jgi:hypothetical protein